MAAPISPELESRLRKGLELHQQGKLEEAEPIYREVVAEAPFHFDALHLLGIVKLQTGQPASALILFDRATAVGPNDIFGHYNRALALHALERWEEAILSWDRVLAINPDYIEAHVNRGLSLLALKRFEDAVASFQRALRLNPNFGDALKNLGIAYRELGRLQDAVACWDRLLWLFPELTEVQADRAAVLETLKR
jgi:tetratricopeptide (TPR) repeat protein